jgi:hypothetical protein
MIVGERPIAFRKAIPQSGCGARLLDDARSAFPLLGQEIGEERFHDRGEIVGNAFNLLNEVLAQREVDRTLTCRIGGAALHAKRLLDFLCALYAHSAGPATASPETAAQPYPTQWPVSGSSDCGLKGSSWPTLPQTAGGSLDLAGREGPLQRARSSGSQRGTRGAILAGLDRGGVGENSNRLVWLSHLSDAAHLTPRACARIGSAWRGQSLRQCRTTQILPVLNPRHRAVNEPPSTPIRRVGDAAD